MRSKAARKAAVACASPAVYNWMRISVPMWGSTASNILRSAAGARPDAASMAKANQLVLVMFQAAMPVAVHFIGAGNLCRTHQPEAEPLCVGVIPDALRQLRILLLPVRARSHPRRAPQRCGSVV